jgi:hypothetical protein
VDIANRESRCRPLFFYNIRGLRDHLVTLLSPPNRLAPVSKLKGPVCSVEAARAFLARRIAVWAIIAPTTTLLIPIPSSSRASSAPGSAPTPPGRHWAAFLGTGGLSDRYRHTEKGDQVAMALTASSSLFVRLRPKVLFAHRGLTYSYLRTNSICSEKVSLLSKGLAGPRLWFSYSQSSQIPSRLQMTWAQPLLSPQKAPCPKSSAGCKSAADINAAMPCMLTASRNLFLHGLSMSALAAALSTLCPPKRPVSKRSAT